MIYIHKNLRYKLKKDLNIYKPKIIESTYIKVINDKRLNTISACIYKHQKTTAGEFTNDFMLSLLEKLSLEKKEIMLMVHFNISSDIDKEISNFLDNINTNSFSPTINLPTRIAALSKTLTDNIFYNDICKKIKAGNIATTISDHLTQFLAILSKETTIVSTDNIMKPSFKDFHATKFKNELNKINRQNKLQIGKNNPHLFLRFFLKTIEIRKCPINKVSKKRFYKQSVRKNAPGKKPPRKLPPSRKISPSLPTKIVLLDLWWF